MEAPIYTDFYIIGSEGDIKVEDQNGDINYLKRISLDEITRDTLFYVEINHEIAYPYAAVDFTEIVEGKALKRLERRGGQPRQFCQGSLVATPKMALL